MRKRILIDNYGPDENNLKKAFSYALSVAEKENKSISILVPTLNNLDAMVRVFGDDFVKQLKKNPLVIGNGLEMNLLTDTTMTKKVRYPIFLCVYSTHYMMDKIQKLNEIEYEIYLPWMKEDIENYNKYSYTSL